MHLAKILGYRADSPSAPLRLSQHVGGIGAMLTCPCHAVPILLVLGGTAGGAWLAQHFTLLVAGLGALFLLSLWLLFRPKLGKWGGDCSTCEVVQKPSLLDREFLAPPSPEATGEIDDVVEPVCLQEARRDR